MEHWPKIAIIIGVILLIIILNAIFTNVNKNDHTNDSALTPTNKHYTDTMKSANSTVKSVVTVENEGSKILQFQIIHLKQIMKLVQVSSTRKWATLFYYDKCACSW